MGSSVGRSTGSWPELQHRRPDSGRRRRPRQKVSSLAHVYPQAPHHLSEQPHAEADSTKKPSLACPFFKLDPDTHQDCRRYELKRVKDVKQHLHRKHSNTSCCPRCSTAFDSAESLAEHHRSVQLCELRDVSDVNGITEAQWKMLSQYHGRGKHIEDQWSDIWAILFPEKPPPESIYLGTYPEEVLSRLRAFWSNKRSEIISTVSHDAAATCVSGAACAFDQVVECLLDQFAAETGASSCWDAQPRRGTRLESVGVFCEANCRDDNLSYVSTNTTVMEHSPRSIGDYNTACSFLSIGYCTLCGSACPSPANVTQFHAISSPPHPSTDFLPDFTYEPELAAHSLFPQHPEHGFQISSPSDVSTYRGSMYVTEVNSKPSYSGVNRRRDAIGEFSSVSQQWI